MADLKNELLEDMKEAMKEKQKKKLSVIRMARAAIKNEEINKRKELEDEEVIEVLARQVKQLKDSIPDYEKSNKGDAIKEIKKEINILSDYLPEQLTAEEIHVIVQEVITEVGAKDMSDLGKVMGAIMPRVKGRAEGSKVNEIVKEKLLQD